MLRNFMKKISGTISMVQIESEVSSLETEPYDDDIASEFASDRHSKAGMQVDAWWTGAEPLFKIVADQSSKRDQSLALRAVIVKAVEDKHSAAFFLKTENSIEDIALLCVRVDDSDGGTEELLLEASEEYARFSLTARFARHLSGKFFNDARENDYFKLLESLSSQFAHLTFRTAIAGKKGESYLFVRMLPTIKQSFEDTKRVVSQGGNYDSTDLDKDEEDAEVS